MKISVQNPRDRKKHLKFLYEFIKKHKLAVIATTDGNGRPEAAVIGVAVDKNLEIICGTYNTSRKYLNLKKNARVALVIGWEKAQTVQYEGIAEELDENEAEQALDTILAKTPSAARYVEREYKVVYRIKPSWIRFSDLSKDPWYNF